MRLFQGSGVRPCVCAFARNLLVGIFFLLTLWGNGAYAQTSGPLVNGLKWLNAQILADGKLSSESQSIATPLQARAEVAQTLQLLGSAPASLLSSIATESDTSTEYLARKIIALAAAKNDTSVLVAQLTSRINPDGGFGGAPGYTSNVLDTSLALVALKQAGRTDGVAAAIAYLQSVQGVDGSFQLNGRIDLYSSIYALAAYRAHASALPLTASIQTVTSYLMAQQSTPGTWNSSVFLSCLAYESLHDFIPAVPTATAVQTYLLNAQMPDGSWGGDPYQTALALRALSISQFNPADPSLATIKGNLVESQTGFPIAGVRVVLTGTKTVEATTGADGNFVFTNQTPGNYSLNFTLANYSSVSATTNVNAGQVLDLGTIKLTKANTATTATIYGVVTDAATGAPLAGATIASTTLSAVTDAKGAYQFANVTPGDIAFTVSKTGFNSANASIHIDAGVALVYSPKLTANNGPDGKNALIQGQVVDATTNAPLPGVSVSITDGKGSQSVQTDASGKYIVQNLNAGSYTISFAANNYSPYITIRALAAGQTLNMGTVKLTKLNNSATATISGVATNAATGQPIAGVAILGGTFGTVTDAQGNYQLPNVTPGDVTLTVNKTGFKPLTAPLHVAAGATLTYSPGLTVSDAADIKNTTVFGVVMDAGTNQPLAGVAVVATDGAGPHTMQTDASGKFSFAEMVKDNGDGVALSFSTAQYVSSTNYVLIDGIATLDMGQVRLRRVKTTQLLADLAVVGVSRTGAITNPQTLKLTGQVAVTLQNLGSVDVPAGVKMLAFQDTNKNGIYDAGVDQVLGSLTMADPLASGKTVVLQVPVQGTMPFRDAPISVWADSDQTLIEMSKTNNLRSTAYSVEIKPDPTQFQVKLKWEWTGSPILPTFKDVMNTPIVLPIQDTNGDGKFDQRDVPGIVFNSFEGVSFNNGVLRAISGKDGKELWTVSDPALRTMPHTSVAGGDIDGDGKVDIIAIKDGGGVMAFDNMGKLKWISQDRTIGGDWLFWGGASIADLDHDGKAEIIVGNTVLNSDGTTRWKGSGFTGTNFAGALSVVADINLDGNPVVIAGAQAYRGSDGATLWKNDRVGDGPVAVGNFTGDRYPQIVVVSYGKVSLLDHNGEIIWGPVQLPGGGYGGAPIIADLDGDGIPEIGVAMGSRYIILKGDGSILWTSPTQDLTSTVTSSSAFDFAGDGHAKVVYADETTLHVYNGADGSPMFNTPHSSGTALEEPVIVDVDGDGHADILVGANQWTFVGPNMFHGIRVFSDVNNAWVGTRKIWNQHSYHITNINDDGSVPRVEKNSWEVSNTYRLNARIGIPSTAVPDVTASYIRVNDQGASKPSTFTVRIGNAGLLPIDAGTSVAFYSGQAGAGGTLLGTAVTGVDLNTNEYQDVVLTYTGSIADIKTLVVVADDDGKGGHTLSDFDISNNAVSLSLDKLAGTFDIAVGTDASTYQSNANVQITATVNNLGSFDNNAQVQFVVRTADGVNVAVLPKQTVKIAAAAQSQIPAVWNTASTIAGKYQVVAQLLDADGVAYAQAQTAITIGSGNTVLTAKVISDKTSYGPADTVQLSDTINNAAQNLPVDNVQVTTVITNPDGTVRFSKTETLAQLPATAAKNYAYSVPLNNAAPGQYGVKVTATAGGSTVQAASTFVVTASSSNGSGLTGTIAVTPSQVQAGGALTLNFSASNQGNSALNNQALSVNIIDPASQKVVAQFPYTTTLGMGASFSGNTTWTAVASKDATYVATLTASFGANTVTLAQANFTVKALQYKLNTVIDSDKANYAPTDVVKLHDKVSNITPNQAVSNLQVVVTVKNPDGSTRFTKTENLASLAIDAAQDYNYSINLSSAPAGQYTTSVVVSAAGNTVISQASGGFIVASTASTGSGLKGSITASAAQVAIGNVISFSFNVNNQGNADMANLPLTVSIVDATQKVIASFPYTTNLAIAGTYYGNTDWTSAGTAGAQYNAVLSTKVGSTTLTLGQVAFSLTSPVVSLNVTQATAPWQNVLVYSACKRAADELLGKCAATKFPTENATTLAQCDATRSAKLDQTLTSLGISHTVTTDVNSFINKLRSGNYNTYWVSNGASAVQEPVAGELLASIKRGDSFMLDSLVTATNSQLAQCSGVTNNGAYTTALQQLSINAGIFSRADLNGPATQTKLAANGGTVEATLNSSGTTSPGIVSAAFGRGKTLAFGYDWNDTLVAQASDNRWTSLLKSGMAYLTPAAADLNALLPGEVSTLTTTINNVGASQPVRIVQSLPAGSVIQSSTPAAVIGDSGSNVTATWNLSAASAADTVVSVRWKAPMTAGSYSANLAVSMVNGSTVTPYKSQDQAIKVLSASQLNAQTISLVQGLSLTTAAQLAQRTAIIDLLNQANTAMGNNTMDKALRLLITVQGKLKNIETGAGPVNKSLASVIAVVERQIAR